MDPVGIVSVRRGPRFHESPESFQVATTSGSDLSPEEREHHSGDRVRSVPHPVDGHSRAVWRALQSGLDRCLQPTTPDV